jgi:signal transduction histidine kinase/ActR/RegA family two-component response regulator
VLYKHRLALPETLKSACSLQMIGAANQVLEVRVESARCPDTDDVHTALIDETAQRRAEAELRELNEELERRVVERSLDVDNSKRALAATDAKLRAREDELRHAQKMDAIGRLASGLAHEFNNLLMGIIGSADMCLDLANHVPAIVEPLERLREAALGGADMVRQLMVFSHRTDPAGNACLDEVVQRYERLLQKMLGDDIQFRSIRSAPRAWVPCTPTRIGQVLMNLSINARQAMPRGGSLRIETRLLDVADEAASAEKDLPIGRYAVLEVTDSGHGMDAQTRDKAFEPFFTTKVVGEGTGLGLATVYAIATSAGGRVTLESGLGSGTQVTVTFPVTGEPYSELPATVPPPTLDFADTVVLLVEDDALVRDAIRHYLQAAGMLVEEAHDGGEALLMCRDLERRIDVVVTDIALPHLSGDELGRELASLRPGLPVLYVTAYEISALQESGRLPRNAQTLHKPFDARRLVTAVRRALDSRSQPPSRR